MTYKGKCMLLSKNTWKKAVFIQIWLFFTLSKVYNPLFMVIFIEKYVKSLFHRKLECLLDKILKNIILYKNRIRLAKNKEKADFYE